MTLFRIVSPRSTIVFLLALSAAQAPAAVLVNSVTGSLLGNQTLPQFNPALGTLTGTTFQVTSSASGQTDITGVLIPASPGVPPFLPPTPAGCVVGGSIVTYTITGYLNNLNHSSQDILFATGTPPTCTVSGAFSETVNKGPTAALGALANYIGLGNMLFNFAIANNNTATWTGTLEVAYTYTPAISGDTVPEPSTWLLGASSLVALAWRRRSTKSSFQQAAATGPSTGAA